GARLVGYVCVASGEQGGEGVGLAAERAALRAVCERRGWRLLRIEQDLLAGGTVGRAGLDAALAACRAGEADGIVVCRVEWLGRGLSRWQGCSSRRARGASTWSRSISAST